MRLWQFGFLMLLWMSVPAAAQQQQRADEEGEVCLALARTWSGTLAETRNIRTVPVPPSFRAEMDGGGCARFQLVKESLIDWHLAFGDEASTNAALSYLQAELLKGLPEPSGYGRALRRAMRSDPGRLKQLAQADFQYRQLARAALAGAEEFGSLPFLARAEPVVRALEERLQLLAAPNSGFSEAEQSNLDGDRAVVTELRMQAAVLRAHLTRSPADIEAADALLRSAAKPVYADAAEVAFSDGGSFCDISDNHGAKGEAAQQACQDDDFLAEKVIGYWRNRAMLDLVIGAPANRSDETALRLLEKELGSGGGRCCGFGAPSDLLRLRLMASDRHRRAFAAPAGPDTDRYEHWQEALDHLEAALRMTPPSHAPARFRRIAEQWLTIWGQRNSAQERMGADTGFPVRLHRHAAYLRALLPDLDAIAAGAE